MIHFSFPFGVEVSIDSESPDLAAPIQYSGDGELIDLIRLLIEKQYGIFGHQIGSATTPVDLNHVMLHPSISRFQPQIVDGAEMVRRYKTNIPEGKKP